MIKRGKLEFMVASLAGFRALAWERRLAVNSKPLFALRGLAVSGMAAALLACATPEVKQGLRIQRLNEFLATGQCASALPLVNAGIAERDPDVLYVAGFMFARGICVGVDVPRALPLLEAAAKATVIGAARELTLIHGTGRGVEQSYAQAGRWAIAQFDIAAKLDRHDGLKEVPELKDGLIAVDYALHVGYLATIHERAGDLVRGETVERRYTKAVASKLTVRLTLPGPAISIVGGEIGDASFKQQVAAAYERAMMSTPPPNNLRIRRFGLEQPYQLTLR